MNPVGNWCGLGGLTLQLVLGHQILLNPDNKEG